MDIGSLPLIPLKQILIQKESYSKSQKALDQKFPDINLLEVKKELINLRAILLSSKEVFEDYEKRFDVFEEKFSQNPPPLPIPPQNQQDPQQRRKQTIKSAANSNRIVTRQNSQRSETSQRTQSRVMNGIENKMDIWYRSAPLFGPLPDRRVIEQIFQIAMPVHRDPPRAKEHWSFELERYVLNTPEKPLKHPPQPIARNTDISKFWIDHSVPFQIETAQKYNRSTLHGLLSALVRTDLPMDAPKDPQKNHKHILAPHIPYHSYFSLNFDERLELELKSLELDKGSVDVSDSFVAQDNNISQVAKSYEQDLDRNLQELLPIKNYIEDNMDKFVEKYRERQENIKEVQQRISTFP